MLEKLFEQRGSIERLHSNPFASHLDSFAASLVADAYRCRQCERSFDGSPNLGGG